MNYLLIYNEVWVLKSYLEKIGVSRKTILNGCNRNKNRNDLSSSKQWISAKSEKIKGDFFIQFSSIPSSTRRNHNLLSVQSARGIAQIVEEGIVTDFERITILCLFQEVQFRSRLETFHYRHFYDDLPVHNNLRDSYSKTHTVFVALIELNSKAKFSQSLLFKVYKVLQFTLNLTFKTTSYRTFSRKFKMAKDEDIYSALIHGLVGKPSNSLKLSERWLLKVEQYYRDPRKLTVSQIHQIINKDLLCEGENEISYSTIYRIINDPYKKNKNLLLRRGEQAYKLKYTTYSSLKTNSGNEIWQMDGTRFPFIIKGPDKKLQIFDFVIVLDVYSGKILGASLGKEENYRMIKSALFDSISNEGNIPRIIIHDGAKSFVANGLKTVKDVCHKYGMDWTKHSPYHPQSKGTIERVNQTLNNLCFRSIRGFLGEGIKSKRDDAHPSKEELLKIRKWENTHTEDEAIEILYQAIDKYNKYERDHKFLKSKISPEKCLVEYGAGGIPIKPEFLALSFFNRVERKINRAVLEMEYDKKKYLYDVPERNRLQLIGQKVIVTYDPLNPNVIYLFDPKTENFICSMHGKTVINMNINQRTEIEKIAYKKEKAENKFFIKSVLDEIKEEEAKLSTFEEGKITYDMIIPGVDSKPSVRFAETTSLFDDNKFYTNNDINLLPKKDFEVKESNIEVITRKFKLKKIQDYE